MEARSRAFPLLQYPRRSGTVADYGLSSAMVVTEAGVPPVFAAPPMTPGRAFRLQTPSPLRPLFPPNTACAWNPSDSAATIAAAPPFPVLGTPATATAAAASGAESGTHLAESRAGAGAAESATAAVPDIAAEIDFVQNTLQEPHVPASLLQEILSEAAAARLHAVKHGSFLGNRLAVHCDLDPVDPLHLALMPSGPTLDALTFRWLQPGVDGKLQFGPAHIQTATSRLPIMQIVASQRNKTPMCAVRHMFSCHIYGLPDPDEMRKTEEVLALSGFQMFCDEEGIAPSDEAREWPTQLRRNRNKPFR
eukprot:m.16554 g.16554  ORF g.16554 m.16554 type:complete len:307 (+) comp7660_c0_seq1:61-981(+)